MLTSIKAAIATAKTFAVKNAPTILTVAASAGVVAVGYLAAKEGISVGRKLDDLEEYSIDEPTTKEKAEVIVKGFAPAAAVGAVTIAAIISSNVINIRRQKQLATCYAMAREALDVYKSKVIEKLGEKKEAELRGEIAEDYIHETPPSSCVVHSTGHGDVLFMDRVSGRYFRSNIDYIRKQQLEINRWLSSGCEEFVSVNDWYGLLGLPELPDLEELGWSINDGVNFEFNHGLTDDNEPCCVIDYSIGPRYDFRTLY